MSYWSTRRLEVRQLFRHLGMKQEGIERTDQATVVGRGLDAGFSGVRDPASSSVLEQVLLCLGQVCRIGERQPSAQGWVDLVILTTPPLFAASAKTGPALPGVSPARLAPGEFDAHQPRGAQLSVRGSLMRHRRWGRRRHDRSRRARGPSRMLVGPIRWSVKGSPAMARLPRPRGARLQRHALDLVIRVPGDVGDALDLVQARSSTFSTSRGVRVPRPVPGWPGRPPRA